jgi:hypothetical protein
LRSLLEIRSIMSWYISTLLILINLALLPATAYWNMAMHFHLANFYIMSIHVHARYLLVLYNETGRTKPSENVPRHQKISAVRLEMVVCDSSFLREGRTRRQAGLNGHRGMIFRDGNFWRLLSEVKKKSPMLPYPLRSLRGSRAFFHLCLPVGWHLHTSPSLSHPTATPAPSLSPRDISGRCALSRALCRCCRGRPRHPLT